MRRLIKFWGLPAGRRRVLVEAALYLLLARLALKALSFRRLVWFLECPPSQPEITGVERVRLRQEVSWAIVTAARSLPGETVCFPQAIAAQAMLRRRRVGTTLYYGAATLPERGLTAHVWVQDGAEGVVGQRDVGIYHVLACYPETHALESLRANNTPR